ncbi:MAG: type II toxin-antitoxin system RelE family toxin [Armatimonadota bacterium]
MTYRIEYSPEAEEHLRALTARRRAIAVDSIDRQLDRPPTVRTRNRRLMRPNLLAPWELRIGSLRVYYDVSEEPERMVYVLAVGVKRRDRLRIGKEVIKL